MNSGCKGGLHYWVNGSSSTVISQDNASAAKDGNVKDDSMVQQRNYRPLQA